MLKGTPTADNFEKITEDLQVKIVGFNSEKAVDIREKVLKKLAEIDRIFREDNEKETLLELAGELKNLQRKNTNWRISKELSYIEQCIFDACQKKLGMIQRKKASHKACNRRSRSGQEQVVFESWLTTILGSKDPFLFTITRSQQTGRIVSVIIDGNGFAQFGGAYMDKLFELLAARRKGLDPNGFTYMTGEYQADTRNRVMLSMAKDGRFKLDLDKSDITRETKCKIIQAFVERMCSNGNVEIDNDPAVLAKMKDLGVKTFADGSRRKPDSDLERMKKYIKDKLSFSKMHVDQNRQGVAFQAVEVTNDDNLKASVYRDMCNEDTTYSYVTEGELSKLVKCKITSHMEEYILKACGVKISKDPVREAYQNQDIEGELNVNPQTQQNHVAP